jgi:D-3-phosphoglycerate dehydrogenase
MKPTILIADGLETAGQHILAQGGDVSDQNGISPADLSASLNQYDALIVRSRTRVTADLLAAAPRLKVVGRAGVGVDNIDLAAAQARGVIVVNSPTATTLAVAELTLALMLDLARLTPAADAKMKAGVWDKKNLVGAELYGKTIGIIGVGNIGGAVASRAAAFGMAVIGYDAWLPAERVRANGAQPASLPELYARADYISLHVPLTPETRGMIGAAAIAQMKPGVRIVCAARGGVIDEAALLDALGSGRVAGAGLDVFEQEPPGASPLVLHPRVVATPHIGAQTQEAQERAAVDIAGEILRALRGEDLRWRVV